MPNFQIMYNSHVVYQSLLELLSFLSYLLQFVGIL